MSDGLRGEVAALIGVAIATGLVSTFVLIDSCNRKDDIENPKTEQVSDSTTSTSKDLDVSVLDLAVQNDNKQNSIVSFKDPQYLRHVRLVGYQTYSVNYYFPKGTEGNDWDGQIYPGAREYNVCTFDDGTRNITLMTKSPTALVPYSNYSVDYFKVKRGLNLNAEKYIKEYVGKSYKTLDNYRFDKNIEGVIENLFLEVK